MKLMTNTFNSTTFGELKAMSINFDAVAPKEVIVTYNPKRDELNYYVQPDYHQYFQRIIENNDSYTFSQKVPDTLKVIVNTSGSSTYDYGEYTIDPRGVSMPAEVIKLVWGAKFYIPSYI